MTPGPIEFRGPMGIRGPIRGPMHFRGHMEMTLTNQFVEHRRSFSFFEITLNSGENCGIFLFFFGVHKARDAQYLG